MKRPLLLIAAATLLGTAAPAFAHGNVSCKSGPASGWKSIDVLKAKLTAQGWAIRKAQVEGDCFEVYGKTPEGENVEAFFHPVTLAKLMVMRRGQMLYKAPGFKP